MHKRFLLFYFLLFTFYFSNAQVFGGNPSSVKWKQINTDTVRIIFPETLDSEAKRIATLTIYEQQTNAATIGKKIKKVNIVLQNDVTFSNGFVQLAPYRSEFYLMPSLQGFDLGTQNWVDNLAIHEFRHVQQYNNFREGLSKVAYDVFGEGGQEVANDAAIPNWFYEGDAVFNETLLSEQGRGRLPSFLSGYESMFFENKNYSYEKLRNGSLKNYVPDHYPLGYMLVAYGREKYGMNFWEKVTQDAVRFKPLFYPLQGAVEKYAGIPFNEFVKNAFAFYDEQWQNKKPQNISWLTSTQKNNVVDYKYPYSTEDGGLFVLKQSYKDVPSIIKINADKSETKIIVRDISYDDYFSCNAGKLVFSAFQADARWGNKEYSVIKMVDINAGEEKNITSHTRYFTPDISHDGNEIAAVSINGKQHCTVDILNINGEKIKSLISNSNIIYTYPKFSADDHFLFIIARKKDGEMSLQKIDITDNSTEILLPFANRILGYPVVKNDTLLYSCSNNGRDEIWCFIQSQNKNYRLANFATGLYQAAFQNNHLIASAFTADGYRLANFTPLWQSTNTNDTLTNLYVTKPFTPEKNNTLKEVGVKDFPVSTYPKLYHPFNFHTIEPNYSDPNFSLTLEGENVLNTLQTNIFYQYNRNEKYSEVGGNIIYGGWFLQPVIGINETFQRSEIFNNTNYNWNELNANIGLQLPLNFTEGKQYRFLNLYASDNIDNVQWTGIAKQNFSNLHFNYIQSSISFTNQCQQALQHIYPHWAQTFFVQYKSIVNKYSANQFLATANIFLPGILKTHSIVLSAAYQSRDTANEYSFSNDFPFSRGYNAVNFPRMYKLAANYHFPLFYPDCGFENIIYFTRIRANAFFDYTNAHSLRTGNNYQFKTAGAEIYFDTKWWNQQALTFGIRYSRLLNNELTGQNANQFEIILPANIFR